MKTIILFALLSLSALAHADNYLIHKPAANNPNPNPRYTTYQHVKLDKYFKNCTRVSAKEFIKIEKLAPNDNLAGGYYCKQPAELRPFAIVKDIRK